MNHNRSLLITQESEASAAANSLQSTGRTMQTTPAAASLAGNQLLQPRPPNPLNQAELAGVLPATNTLDNYAMNPNLALRIQLESQLAEAYMAQVRGGLVRSELSVNHAFFPSAEQAINLRRNLLRAKFPSANPFMAHQQLLDRLQGLPVNSEQTFPSLATLNPTASVANRVAGREGISPGYETATDNNQSIPYPCQARGMPLDHNSTTAYFDIPSTARHGKHLICSYPACRDAGCKFRYCFFCKKPVTKKNFRARHLHEAEVERKSSNDSPTNMAPSKKRQRLDSP